MINRGDWRKIDKVKIPENRRLIGNKWVFKIKRDGTYTGQDFLLWDTAKFQELTTQTTLPQWHMMSHSG